MKASTKNLIRVLIDYKKLNDTILKLITEKYPDGYDDDDIITYRNTYNEVVECIEVKTDDTIYLVKVSTRLQNAMEDFDADETNFIED